MAYFFVRSQRSRLLLLRCCCAICMIDCHHHHRHDRFEGAVVGDGGDGKIKEAEPYMLLTVQNE